MVDGTADSLRAIYHDAVSGAAEEEALRDLARYYIRVDADSARVYALQLIEVMEAEEVSVIYAEALYLAGRSNYLIKEYGEALRWYHQSFEVFSALRDSSSMSLLLRSLADAYKYGSLPDSAEAYLGRALTVAEVYGDKDELPRIHNDRGLFYHSRGRYREAITAYSKALNLYTRPVSRARVLNNIGASYTEFGDLERALDMYQEALDLNLGLGSYESAVYVLGNRAHLFYEAGDFVRALDALRRADSLEQVHGTDRGRAWISLVEGWVRHAVGDHAAAVQYFKDAFLHYELTGSRDGMGQSRLGLGVLYLGMGQPDSAETQLGDAIRFLETFGELPKLSEALIALAEVKLLKGDSEEAGKLLDRASELTDGAEMPELKARIHRIRARYFESVGEWIQRGHSLESALYWQDQVLEYRERNYEQIMAFREEVLDIRSENELLRRDAQIQELELSQLREQRRFSYSLVLLFILFSAGLIRRVRINRRHNRVLQESNDRIDRINRELRTALDNVKELKGLLPICANCKKIRDDSGYWNFVEHYIEKHTDAQFTHGLCPVCVEALYPELMEKKAKEGAEGPEE